MAEHAPSGAHVPDAGRVEPVRVAVVDDQAPFRAAARAVIGRTPGFEQVGEAGDGAQALALLADTAVDLVLMDIKMPVLDGIAATGRIAVDHPDVVVPSDVGLVVIGALVVAALVSAVPALAARRLSPARQLRAE